VQLGAWQTFPVHTPVKQSDPSTHARPVAHFGHTEPPQSTSVSLPSLILSMHEVALLQMLHAAKMQLWSTLMVLSTPEVAQDCPQPVPVPPVCSHAVVQVRALLQSGSFWHSSVWPQHDWAMH
jgi:hypothetical protein